MHNSDPLFLDEMTSLINSDNPLSKDKIISILDAAIAVGNVNAAMIDELVRQVDEETGYHDGVMKQ